MWYCSWRSAPRRRTPGPGDPRGRGGVRRSGRWFGSAAWVPARAGGPHRRGKERPRDRRPQPVVVGDGMPGAANAGAQTDSVAHVGGWTVFLLRDGAGLRPPHRASVGSARPIAATVLARPPVRFPDGLIVEPTDWRSHLSAKAGNVFHEGIGGGRGIASGRRPYGPL